jgi:hypothetical protein
MIERQDMRGKWAHKNFSAPFNMHFDDKAKSNGGDNDSCVKWQDQLWGEGPQRVTPKATSRGCIKEHSWLVARNKRDVGCGSYQEGKSSQVPNKEP